jgi:hypothetical protein
MAATLLGLRTIQVLGGAAAAVAAGGEGCGASARSCARTAHRSGIGRVACWLAPRGVVVDLAACRDTILGERQCS